MMVQIKIVLFFLLLYFITGAAFSQNDSISILKNSEEVASKANAISTFNLFRDPSYILFGSGIGNMEPLIFEGDLVPYFMISLSRNVKWGIELSPRIIIRMYNQNSYPVRTPSFMPKVTFFYQFIDTENGKRDLFTYFSWMHHSNGQEGSYYNADSTAINTLSGSFSTNWIEGGVFLSRPNAKLLFNTNYIKLYSAYSYKQDVELDSIYGRLRFFVNIKSTVKLSRFFRIIVAPEDNNKKYVFNQSIQLGWISGELKDTKTFDKKRFIFGYTISFKPTFLKDVNIFVQYYYGQDFYNIHFNRQLSVIRFGIASKLNIQF